MSKTSSPNVSDSLVEDLRAVDRQKVLYRQRPWAFAIGGRGLPPVLGPEVMRTAAKRPVLSFSPQQKLFMRDFCDIQAPRVIAKTGRGGSKTFLAAICIADLAWSFPTFTCTVNAGSLDQSEMLYEYWETFCDSLAMRDPLGPVVGDPKKKETSLRNKGWVKIRAASEKQAKSRHPHLVLLDEACATDPAIMLLLEGQLASAPKLPGAKAALYRIMSTPDKPFHLFRDRWEKRKELGYRGHEWGLRDCPWFTTEEIALLRLEHDDNWWRVHGEGEFGGAGGSVFRYEDVQAAAIPRLVEDPTGLWQLVEEDFSRWVDAVACGVDWGWEHPTVIEVVVRTHVDGAQTMPVLYVVHVEAVEHTPTKDTFELIANAIEPWREWSPPVLLEAAHKREIMELRPVLGPLGSTSRSINTSVLNYQLISEVRLRLERGQTRIPMDGEGADLLRQLSEYSWDPKAKERGGDERPLKGGDDFVDAHKLAVWALRGAGRAPPRALRVVR
ncbi:MAG: hypothetical protein V3U45_08375 [bacterium]